MANQELVERLHAEYAEVLRRYFARRLADPSEAAALTQEVFLRILSLPETSVIRDPAPYLLSVARNLLLEHSKLIGRSRKHVALDDPDASEQLASAPPYAQEFDLERRKRYLRNVLDELRPKCRAAVVLAYWQELTYQDIGQQLGVSANMVKKYLRQAIEHCRLRMADLE